MKLRIFVVVLAALAVGLFAITEDFHDLFGGTAFGDRPLYGLDAWQWLALAMVLVTGLLVAGAAYYVGGWYYRLRAKVAPVPVSRGAQHGVRRSLGLLCAAFVWWKALPGLSLPGRWDGVGGMALEGLSVAGGVWLVFSLWDGLCDTLTERAAEHDRRAEKLLVPVTRKLVRFFIVLGGSLLGLAWMGANVAGVLAGLGIGGLAVALAAKDSVENIFGSLTILFDMPFAIGDWVKIGEIDGVVEEINLRSTRIRTFQDSMVTLPNSNLIKASVENFGVRRYRRLRVQLTVPFDSPGEAVEGFCKDLQKYIGRRPRTRDDQIHVSVHDLTDAGLAILVQCFIECDTYPEELEERSAILLEAGKLARARKLRASASVAPGPSEGEGA